MSDNLPAERGPASMSLTAAADIGFGETGFDINPQTLGEVVGFAKLMSTAQHAIPGHLRDNPGACMAVTLQAMSWKMSPFAVAQKTYKVSDTIAYEAQVIAAVINSRAGFKERPKIEYLGEGPTRKCVVTFTFKNGDVRSYESPEVGRITTKNSPLWKSDVDQQLAYFSIRSAARRHCPEVILGVMDRDEVEYAEPLASETRGEGTGMVERLKANAAPVDAAGFNVRQISEATEAAKPKRGRPKKVENEMLDAIAEVEPELVVQVIQDHGDGLASSEFRHVLPEVAGEDLDEVLGGATIPQDLGATETASAPIAETEVGILASAMGALSDLAVETSGPIASDEPSQSGEPEDDGLTRAYTREEIAAMRDGAHEPAAVEDDDALPEGQSFPVAKRCAGPAPVDTVYILSRAVPGYDGKVATFKNGQPFSKVGRKGALLLNTYDSHRETPATAPEKPQEPVQEAPATNAAQDDKSPFAEFWTMLQAAPTWDETKKVVKALHVFEEFRELSTTDKNLMRAQIWLEVDAKELSVDVAYDPTAFRLWLETQEGRDGADAITGNFRVLKSGDLYQGMSGESQDVLEDVVSAAIQRLRS